MKVLSTAVRALSDRVIATGKALSMNCWKKGKKGGWTVKITARMLIFTAPPFPCVAGLKGKSD